MKGVAALTLAEPDVIGAGFALPRVPTGGRRSLAAGAIWTAGVPARGCILTATVQRSAFPCLRAIRPVGVPARSCISTATGRRSLPGGAMQPGASSKQRWAPARERRRPGGRESGLPPTPLSGKPSVSAAAPSSRAASRCPRTTWWRTGARASPRRDSGAARSARRLGAPAFRPAPRRAPPRRLIVPRSSRQLRRPTGRTGLRQNGIGYDA